MTCLSCGKERVSSQIYKGICVPCISVASKEKEVDDNIRRIEQKEKETRENRIAKMKHGQRTMEEILNDLIASGNDFSTEARKKEAELFAEKRKLKLLETL